MKLWLVYIVQCSDGSYYCGITNDLGKRIICHNSGKASKYTRARLPVELIYKEECENKSIALKRELEIKSFSRKKKEKLIGV